MDLSRIKLVVADMDGTLLNSRHEVSADFFDLYPRLKEKGVRFVAASGRQYDSIVEKLSPIGQEITIIAENGGFVIHEGREMVSNPLERDQKELILDQLSSLKEAHTVLCGKHVAFLHSDSQEFLAILKEYYTHFEIIENLREYPGEVMKIAVYHDLGSEEHIYPHVKHLEGVLKVKVSGENWVDLSHPNAHKGFALEKVQKELSIHPRETLVFGDYNNDLEMLDRADYSFAMANAHHNVLNAARFITSSNDERGVEKVLEALLRFKS